MTAADPIQTLEKASSLYRVFRGEEELQVRCCRVSAVPYNTSWPGRQRPLDQTEEAAFVSFTASGETVLDVEISKELFEGDLSPESDIKVRPLSSGSKAEAAGRSKVRVTLPEPGYYTLETEGFSKCLHIFADGDEVIGFEKMKDSASYRFEKGVYDAGTITLKNGESLYIGKDAVVYGTVEVTDAENVRIFGSGILDNSKTLRYDGSCLKYGALHITRCVNVTVEGIVFRDSSTWTATVIQSRDVTFRNVKAVGMWRYNTDGIDLVNSRDCVIENCFLRTFDDTVALKGLKGFDDRNVENILVRNCVLWCDWGRALEIGAETCADEYKNIVFENCDVIHGDCILMDIQNGDRASVHGVTFRNIRCEYNRHQQNPVYQSDMDLPYPGSPEVFVPVLFKAHLYCGLWSDDMLLGENYDLLLEDINIIKDEDTPMPEIILEGAEKGRETRKVTLRNIMINGKKAAASDLVIRIGKFADFPEIE